MRDVIEPRVKVEGPGVCYPGICGRDIATVGRGRTHRLAGMGVVEVSSVNWHDAGGDFVETHLDMSGPYSEMYPYHRLINLCLVVEPDRTLNEEVKKSSRRSIRRFPGSCTSGVSIRLRPCRARPRRSARRPTA